MNAIVSVTLSGQFRLAADIRYDLSIVSTWSRSDVSPGCHTSRFPMLIREFTVDMGTLKSFGKSNFVFACVTSPSNAPLGTRIRLDEVLFLATAASLSSLYFTTTQLMAFFSSTAFASFLAALISRWICDWIWYDGLSVYIVVERWINGCW